MKLTLADLTALEQSAQFNDTPLAQARQQEGTSAPWWRLMETMESAAAHLMVWQCAQYAAVLFDTYGAAIQDIRMSFDVGADHNDTYVNNNISINGEYCRQDGEWDDEPAREAIEKVDDAEVFDTITEALNDTAACRTISHLGVFDRAFEKPITSAEQARAIADRHVSPVLKSVLVAHGLDQRLPEASAPKPSRM